VAVVIPPHADDLGRQGRREKPYQRDGEGPPGPVPTGGARDMDPVAFDHAPKGIVPSLHGKTDYLHFNRYRLSSRGPEKPVAGPL